MNDLAVVLHYHKKTLAAYDEAALLYRSALVAAKRALNRAKVTKKAKAIAKKTISDANLNIAALRPVHPAAKKAARKAAAARKDHKKQK